MRHVGCTQYKHPDKAPEAALTALESWPAGYLRLRRNLAVKAEKMT